MLQVTGNIARLVDMAERTDSLERLKERLEYLNAYGELCNVQVNVEAEIYGVHRSKNEVDVRVRFIGRDGNPDVHGGLELEHVNGETYVWSVRT